MSSFTPLFFKEKWEVKTLYSNANIIEKISNNISLAPLFFEEKGFAFRRNLKQTEPTIIIKSST